MTTFYDRLLIISVIVVSLIGYGVITVFGRNSRANIVTVRHDGTVILQVADNGKKSEGIYEFDFEGGKGAIEVKDGKVRMLPMDKSICPKSVCSKTGWIKKGPQTIACIPNRLLVKFEGKVSDKIDGATF